MKTVGIIVEYNPMHNGHIHHLKEARKRANGGRVIAVMSGNFVQRGEFSLLDKYEKTQLALEEGVDIVAELPFFYSTQSAEIFSIGAVKTLHALGVEEIVFGCEEENVENLFENVEKIVALEEEIGVSVRSLMETGISYPNAMAKAYKVLNIELELKPNTLLAVEYIKTIIKERYPITPTAIVRKNGGYFDEEVVDDIASASYIRKCLAENRVEEIKNSVSAHCFELIKNRHPISLESCFDMLYFALLDGNQNFDMIQDMEIGLANRLKKNAKIWYNYREFFEKVLSKRYTRSRMQRVLLHILLKLDIKTTEYVKQNLPYIQLLGANEYGRAYLSSIKESVGVTVITNMRNSVQLIGKNRDLFDAAQEHDLLYAFKLKKKIKNIPVML